MKRPYRGPIKSNEDYEACLLALRHLMDDDRDCGDLGDMIAEYEEHTHPIDGPDCVSAVLFRMDQRGSKQGELAELLGGSGRMSEFKTGKKAPSKAQMTALHERFGIPYDVLMNYRLMEPKDRAQRAKAKTTAPVEETRGEE